MENLYARFTAISKEIFGDNLTGIYLHGSAAMGCFNAQKSDLDLILVVDKIILKQDKVKFLKEMVKINEEAPEKGIELSIVKREICDPFIYPTPYELHFSVMYLDRIRENPEDYAEKMQGTDSDLAAHFMVINHYGTVLYGAAIKDVFGEVDADYYIDSIWNDVKNAEKYILSNVEYLTLNLCRVLGYLKENLILSKKSGGEWGLRSVPQEYHDLIQRALLCYASEQEMKIDSEPAAEFAKYMLGEIVKYKGSLFNIHPHL